jgi:hypothetical protein
MAGHIICVQSKEQLNYPSFTKAVCLKATQKTTACSIESKKHIEKCINLIILFFTQGYLKIFCTINEIYDGCKIWSQVCDEILHQHKYL